MRKHIYTTNPVESVNAGIELMGLELGGYFPSQQALEVNLFIQVVNLQDRWWRRPVPTVRVKSYELLQIFAMKYELAEDHETVHISESARRINPYFPPSVPRRGLQPVPVGHISSPSPRHKVLPRGVSQSIWRASSAHVYAALTPRTSRNKALDHGKARPA